MISVTLAGVDAARNRLNTIRDAANQGVARAIAKLGTDLQNNIQQNKLSGQVLHARSGALRQSISVRLDRDPTAVSATVFSDLDYAGAQEYGFSGTVDVRASLRQIKEVFGRPIAARTIAIAAYSRRMDLPERSFLRSALDDLTPDISAGITDALREALE